ncbi:MAG TPA: thiol:disulfide interchange protein DsbG, partial [Gammaproteobacteria bacterium]
MRFTLLFLALLLPGVSAAANPPLPAALQNLLAQGVVVQRSFPGPDGLTGWVVTASGRSLVVFTTPSGDYA